MIKDKGSIFTNWSSLLVLLILSGWGLLANNRPLQMPRPDASAMLWKPLAIADKAPARLWQDPLQAVHRHLESTLHGGAAGLPDIPRIPRPDKDHGHPSVLIMGVTISGDSWPESEDGRIADRYAILSSLGEAGYVPDDRESIQYYLTETLTSLPGKKGAFPSVKVFHQMVGWLCQLPMIAAIRRLGAPHSNLGRQESTMIDDWACVIPYEWFSASGSISSESDKFDKVLVLWLRTDRYLETHQIRALTSLLKELGVGRDEAHVKRSIKVAVLTNNSNRLVDLLEEDAREFVVPADDSSEQPQDKSKRRCTAVPIGFLANTDTISIEFLAYTATISNDELQKELEHRFHGAEPLILESSGDDQSYSKCAETALEKTPSKFELCCGATLHRTIGTDKTLTDLLDKELCLRGAHPKDKINHIAVIHEWDSIYGRSLDATLRKSCKTNERIHSYTFMVGVDGKLPGILNSAGPVITRADADKEKGTPQRGEGEIPIGRGQLDYIRRLVEELRTNRTRWRSNGEDLMAIGVFASDIFDKLPILQALREAMPDVLFFTNDLEAYMVHPSQYETLRNLLIASHFDLQLGALQNTTPPFRTSYQTSLFFSGLLALKDKGAIQADKDMPMTARARMYEVSRRGAYDLSIQDGSGLYPPSPRIRSRFSQTRHYVGLSLVMLFGISLTVFGYRTLNWRISGKANEWQGLLSAGLWLVFWFGVIPLGVSLYFSHLGTTAGDDKPFELAYGISIWPSEMILLIVCLLCVGFLRKGWRDYSKRVNALADEYDLVDTQSCKGSNREQPGRGLLCRWLKPRFIVGWETSWDANRQFVDAHEVWRQYLLRGSRRDRGIRTTMIVLLNAALVIGLCMVMDFPSAPYRGTWSHCIQIILLVTSALLVNILTLCIWDGTRLCDRFVRNLSRGASKWPRTALARIEKRCDISGEIANSLLDILIIAARTEEVGMTIYYPFIALLLLVISRHRAFDQWVWTVPLIAMYGLSAVVAVVAARTLRLSAEAARDLEVRRLRDARLREDDPKKLRQIDQVIEQILDLHTGAFAPFSQKPVVRAVLLPFGGLGVFQLIDFIQGFVR